MINLFGKIVISVVFICFILIILLEALCENIDAITKFYIYIKQFLQIVKLDAIDLYYELKFRIKGK